MSCGFCIGSPYEGPECDQCHGKNSYAGFIVEVCSTDPEIEMSGRLVRSFGQVVCSNRPEDEAILFSKEDAEAEVIYWQSQGWYTHIRQIPADAVPIADMYDSMLQDWIDRGGSLWDF